MSAIRVVLADDQPLVRAGLRMILDTEPDLEVVGRGRERQGGRGRCAPSAGRTSC